MNFDSQPRRVVITGMGVIAPNGNDLGTFWSTIVNGVSAGCKVTRFDTSNVPNKIAAEVRDFNCCKYIDPKKARRFDLSIQYGMSAAHQAVNDAGVDFRKYDPDRVGIVEATSVSGMESTLNAHVAFLNRGYKGMSPFTFINAYCGGGSGEIALELGIKGHAITYCSGSASGNDAIGYAMKMIRDDEVDMMVAGGSEAPLMEAFWSGFCVTKVMTRRNKTPQTAMRPFDRNRDGFLLGEGAGFMVLEELSHALGRGAKIYAEVVGHGRSCEAYSSVSPQPDGVGLVRAMEKALRQARLEASEINYINAHGTATELNDLVETRAIKKVFGHNAGRVAISSTKPVTGHLLGAAGALETIVCALTIHHQRLAPTVNLTEPAPECDLDYIPGQARQYPARAVMNLNTGFGGKNSCLILKEFK
jgi:3-oxoacyl-[acyl-carrier-protein] synthase II